MFQRVKETISDYAATAQTSRKQRITRRRVKPSFMAQRQHRRRPSTSSKGENSSEPNDDDGDNDDNDDDDDGDDDNRSVQSTITVETTRTANNENRKPTANPNQAPTQVFVEPSDDDPYLEASEVLERAKSDITKLSIYLRQIEWTRKTASAFIGLVRGDNRSWEAIAVDILRQKARWENITIEDCEGEYLDTVLGFLMNGVDQCSFLHLSNLLLTPNGAWAFRSLQFGKNITKLQLDLIDLSFAIPMLCLGLQQNSSIECLIASRCGLNDDRLQELFTSLPKQLAELRIFGNRCREKGLAAITAVVHHSQHLKILDLSYQHVNNNNNSRNNNDGEFDVSWLAGALHHNRTLKVLDLDNDGIDDGHLTHLCAAFCANETLEEVMLNHNRITAMGIALLSQKFGEMKGLKKISMYSNLFDAPQVVDSAAVVSQNITPLPRQITQNTGAGARTTEGGAATASPDEEVTSDLEDDGGGEEGGDDDKDDEDNDDEFDYEEEIIGEVDDDDDDDDNDDGENEMEVTSYEGDFIDDDDDSSAPPPSADFREPEEMENDSIAVDGSEEYEESNNGGNDVSESSTPATVARKNVTDFLPEYWSSPKPPTIQNDNSVTELSVATQLGEPVVEANGNNESLSDKADYPTDLIPDSFTVRIQENEAMDANNNCSREAAGPTSHKSEESFSEAELQDDNEMFAVADPKIELSPDPSADKVIEESFVPDDDAAAPSPDSEPEEFPSTLLLEVKVANGDDSTREGTSFTNHKEGVSTFEAAPALEDANDDEEGATLDGVAASTATVPPPKPSFSDPLADEASTIEGSSLPDKMFAVSDPEVVELLSDPPGDDKVNDDKSFAPDDDAAAPSIVDSKPEEFTSAPIIGEEDTHEESTPRGAAAVADDNLLKKSLLDQPSPTTNKNNTNASTTLSRKEELQALYDHQALIEFEELKDRQAKGGGEHIDEDRLNELELFARYHNNGRDNLTEEEQEELDFFQHQRDLYIRFQIELEQMKEAGGDDDDVDMTDSRQNDPHRMRLLELAMKKHGGQDLSATELDDLVEFIVEEEDKEGGDDDDDSDDE